MAAGIASLARLAASNNKRCIDSLRRRWHRKQLSTPFQVPPKTNPHNHRKPDPQRRFLLWDSSAVISYYLPKTAATPKAVRRIRNLVQAARNHRLNAFFYIPNIVVAEVFVAFDRNYYSAWSRPVNNIYGGKGKSLHGKRYRSARLEFRRDIHNGALFYQCELNRYHILALDLISPVDKHRKIYRKGHVPSMGASDLLIGAMAMHFAKIHGKESVALITTDRRMEAVIGRACPQLNANTADAMGFQHSARELGFGDWNPDLYPRVIDIARCSDDSLADFFGDWPLPTRRPPNRPPRA